MSIHFIYIGSLPSQSDDHTMLTTAIKQACRVYYAEFCTLWVFTTDELPILDKLFEPEIAAKRLKIIPINFLQILSSPKFMVHLDACYRMLPESHDFPKDLSPEAIVSTLVRHAAHMIATCQKISNITLIKDLILPLLLANQALNDEDAHVFDLAVFFDEFNDVSFVPQFNARIQEIELRIFNVIGNPAQVARSQGKLPRWDTIKIPIKVDDQLRQWARMRPTQIHDDQLRMIPKALYMDTWWMYTSPGQAAAVFYTTAFLNILNLFLIKFPNISDEIQAKSAPYSMKFAQYVRSLQICTFKPGLYEANTDMNRVNYLTQIFMDAYASAFFLYFRLSQMAQTLVLSVFTLCYNGHKLSQSTPDLLLERIAARVGGKSNAFYNRFVSTTLPNIWCSKEVGYYKSMRGEWHAPPELRTSDQEIAMIRGYLA